MTGTVLSVNISEKKGTVKEPVPQARVTRLGLEHDAHAGPWHRQVSLLAREHAEALGRECGRSFAPGAFGENLSTVGLDLGLVGLRDRLKIGTVELEVTQIGKSCHGDGCAIHRAVGRCVMPKQGIFTRVLQAGDIRPGACIELVPHPLRITVITLSDRASRGEYADRSGPAVRQALEQHFAGSRWHLDFKVHLLPDEATALTAAIQATVAAGADIIFTTGGTGIGPRDITPDTVRPLLDKEIPGIMEAIRVNCGRELPSALLSRSVAGVIGSTLVYTLPGSVRAVNQYLAEITRSLEHALLMLWAIDAH